MSNGVITTIAGNGTAGFSGDNGPAVAAKLNVITAVAVDAQGNVFIADSYNQRVRKVSGGIITTVAGNGSLGFSGDNGPATSAQLGYPNALALDSAGSLYIATSSAYEDGLIREVSDGVITTIAGVVNGGLAGENVPATAASLPQVLAIAVDPAGDLYLTAFNNVRKISNGLIMTIAGSSDLLPGFSGDGGPALNAHMNFPMALAVDATGRIYVAETTNDRVRLLTPNPVPSITQNGVVPVYSSVPVIQPGSWVSIYGTNLTNGDYTWKGDFPTSLGGVTVTINGKPAYLWIVSPTQINLQAPDDTTVGPVSVAVNGAFGTAASIVTLAAYGPSFSLLGDGKHAVGEIATPDGSGAWAGGTYDLVGPLNAFSFNTRPVKAGETLTLFGVGFGPTTPHVPAGKPFSGAAPTNSPVTVTIGGISANVTFAGIIETGLYQINLTVPANLSNGDQPLQATVNGVQTPVGPVITVQ